MGIHSVGKGRGGENVESGGDGGLGEGMIWRGSVDILAKKNRIFALISQSIWV